MSPNYSYLRIVDKEIWKINLFIFASSNNKQTYKKILIMEQNKNQSTEMTAQESFALISNMLNNSRRDILQSSAKYFVLWGVLLAVTSLIIYALWHTTGSAKWNLLWFAMAIVGFPLAMLIGRKDQVPQNIISKQIGQVWLAYAAFAIGLIVLAIAVAPLPMSLTLLIVAILGFAECISGVLLKNWPIIVGGFVLGVGGVIAATLLTTEAQMFIFTLGGAVLIVTGIIIKFQYR